MDKCVPIAPDWLMCWTMDLEVWFRNLTASFFFLLLGQTLKSCGASLLSWTSEKVDKLQGGLTCNGLSSWKSNALLHSVSRETGINFSSGSLTLWGFGSQYFPPPLHSIGDNWSYFRSRWKPCDTSKKFSDPLPLVIVPLKFPFILQKRIEEHRSSTAPVGCHVASGVFHPLEWSPCVFVHHTQLDPGTHGSMCSTVADIDQACLIRVPFNSYRVWCFASSMASWMTRYFPTLLVQLWCKFDAEYRILLYSLWRPSELMAYAVKPRHSEL